jgi:hypothetical protein
MKQQRMEQLRVKELTEKAVKCVESRDRLALVRLLESN